MTHTDANNPPKPRENHSLGWLVVDREGKVKPRPVKVGGQRGTQWVVTEGLQAGEQVMVDGFQKLRGDAPVKPVPWTPPGSPAPAAPAPAASR